MATGGFKLSLAGAKGKPGFKKPTEQPTKRRRLALDDDEPEDTDAKQVITGWDAAEGGAVDANKKEEPKGPRIIPTLPNRDWREAAQKRQLARTGAPPPAESSNADNTARLEQPQMAVRLTTFIRKDEPEPMDVDGEVKPEDNRTEEEKLQAEAFEALVNGKPKDQTAIPISEEEAFEDDMREAPDAPDLAAYEATPIEGFGAALLRGMGWKDGDSLSKDKKPASEPKAIKRRPALLGIGAKPEAAVGVELGDWAGPKKGGKKAIQYNPVALKNKRTGEIITEEELKERQAKQKEADAQATRNNTFVGDDEDDGDERRREKRRERKERDRRDDDYDSERRKEKSRRRDRDKEYSDRDRDRRREKKYSEYEDSDRDRRRDKDKKDRDDDYDDRKREKRRERERRDRSRSPYDDDRREKRRERDRRERSVDSKDRREKRRERSRSRDEDEKRRKRRDYDHGNEKEERRSKYKDAKYDRYSRR
ncbi:g-patch domain protein [Paraphaeosphaeria minitans]|uniref:Pre-mRNA-splicing factor n=1 Tax=Paraphaeosphaeria minitans TaxID=565426 RepID=A0A9P6G7P8_9PLEO|nr:g-patch domain protein [Paraphaeosphaeria minitans]